MSKKFNLSADKTIKKILLIKWSAMGDIIISTALFEDIHKAFPEASIDLNILPPWDRLFQGDPRFNEIISVDLRKTEKGMKGFWRWVREVRKRNYDLIVDLQTNDRSRWLMIALHLSGCQVPYRIGNHSGFPYNISRREGQAPLHSYDIQRAALAEAGIPQAVLRPKLYVPVESQQRVELMMTEHGLRAQDYALLLPGCQAAGWLKRWGSENYAALAKLLRANGIAKTIIIGGPDEMDECEKIQQAVGEDWLINLCGKTQIPDIVPFAQSARLMVGNDTGTAHVASCADRPMVVVCGPTDPNRVKPVGENVIALQADLNCINCYCKKPCDHHRCMKEITPQMVLEGLQQLGALSFSISAGEA